MATARKTHTPKGGPANTEQQAYAAFVGDLLDGTVKAVKLIETKPGGKLKLEYDDPNG
jgi:hypothetical protein